MSGTHDQEDDFGHRLHGDHVDPAVYTHFDDGGQHASADPRAGGSERGLPIWTAQQIAEHLNRTGQSWYVNQNGELNDKTLLFGFWKSIEQVQSSYYVNDDGTSSFNEANPATFSAFTAGQMVAAREAIGLWDDLTAISFKETINTQASDITFGNTNTGSFSQAYAYLPFGNIYNDYYEPLGFDAINKLGGDVWINNTIASNFSPLSNSYYAKLTLIHELGHALGLSHPGDYNAGEGQELSYDLADYYQDSLQYSVMSYWDAYETGAQHVDWSLENFTYASTPLVHDVAAIQRLYGADPNTRKTDTVYGFNSTADRDAYDFTKTTRPVVTIYDAGGVDTIDFSGWRTPSTIDLNEGAFSSGGGIEQFLTLEQINANRRAAGLPERTAEAHQFYEDLKEAQGLTSGLYKDNISIAYGTVIERAIGGSGDDLIIANQVANRIDGGRGGDTVSYRTATSGVTVDLAAATTGGGAAGDRLVNIEHLEGSRFNDTLTGAAGTSRLSGGDGNDVLRGGAGNDWLNGGAGNDTLYGDDGRDSFFFDTRAAGSLGNDLVRSMGAGDRIVTTSLFSDPNNDGIVRANSSDVFAYGGDDGTVRLFSTSGRAISSLQLVDQVQQNDQTYYVYAALGDTTPGSGIYV